MAICKRCSLDKLEWRQSEGEWRLFDMRIQDFHACPKGKAGKAFEKNRQAVLRGETFRSRKPSKWRLGKGPSSYG